MLGTNVGTGHVLPEWIDVNGHMNVAYYVLAFDHGVDALWDRLGITGEYIETTRGSTFAVECHVTYQSELKEAEPYVVTSQLLAYDQKRIHQLQRMYHGETSELAATAEWMNLHVDLRTRRVSAWPQDVLEELCKLAAGQGDATMPPEAGKQMLVSSPIYSIY